ncbi:MAG: hypothetical protein K9K87_12345 [Desulfotignum sp.]|nr:hypothetical protein [Desulfotignum sp.]
MSDTTVENQLRFTNAELTKQIALLEKARNPGHRHETDFTECSVTNHPKSAGWGSVTNERLG